MGWIGGVLEMLGDEDIVHSPEAFQETALVLTSTGGLTDIVMLFGDVSQIEMGKMAMWRLRFGDCSWVSDFITNYRDHYIEG